MVAARLCHAELTLRQISNVLANELYKLFLLDVQFASLFAPTSTGP
jgi:hypothetical protein